MWGPGEDDEWVEDDEDEDVAGSVHATRPTDDDENARFEGDEEEDEEVLDDVVFGAQ